MARPTNEDRLATVHREALERQSRAYALGQDEREQAREDRRFVLIPGAMWEDDFGQQFANRPKIEANLALRSLMRIFNQYRSNRISVDFIAKDGSTPDLADVCDDLYRADEQDSGAQHAYDNAFDEGVTGGMGAWRLCAEYQEEDDEDGDCQCVKIEPIYDAASCVFFDPDAKKQDKSDANWCIVLHSMTDEAYLAEWGHDPQSWPNDVESRFDWCNGGSAWVAEYYVLDHERDKITEYVMMDGTRVKLREADLEEDPDAIVKLEAQGAIFLRSRTIKRKRVHKYILSGAKVLEDCGLIAGKHIPIVPFYGRRFFIDNVERFCGFVRYVKDMQRLLCAQLSSLAELSVISKAQKPIVMPEQVAGLETFWTNDQTENYAFLPINPITNADGTTTPTGPVGYTQPPQVPPATAALLQLTDGLMKQILGDDQQGEQVQSNVSAKAVELVQQRIDESSFIYMDNFKKAMRRCGEIWLDMRRDIETDPRTVKGLGKMGETRQIELMRPIVGKDGKDAFENDLGAAKFDVIADVGPAFTTRRDATVRAITNLMQMVTDPATQQVMLAGAIINMDGEGLDDIKEYFRKQLVSQGVMQPSDDDKAAAEQAAQNAKPDAQQQYLQAASAELLAKAEKASADTALTKAKTIDTLAGIERQDRAQALQVAEQIGQAIAPQNSAPAPLNGQSNAEPVPAYGPR